MNAFSLVAIAAALFVLVFAWLRRIPMTYALILANVAVFVLELVAGGVVASRSGSIVIDDLAYRPLYFMEGDVARLYTLLTAGFLHAGFGHIFGNMLILFLAGAPFEERLGRARFLGLYLFALVAGSLVHTLWVAYTNDGLQASVLSLGASGAVFGVLGGFATAYPKERFPIFPIPLIVFTFFARNVPVLLGVLLLAVLDAFLLFLSQGLDGVAHAAHLGGAVGGSVAALLLRPAPGARPERSRPMRQIDYGALTRIAHDDRTRVMVDRVRENADTAELQRAWLDRLLVALRCPACGHGYAEVRPGVLECDLGHREKYVV